MKAKGAIVFRGIFYCFLALLFGITLAKGMFGGDIKSLCIAVVCLAGVGIYLLVRKRWKVLLVLFAFFFAGNGLFFAGMAVWGGNDYADTVAIVGRVDDQLYDYNSDTLQKAILKDVTINGKSEKNIALYIYLNGEEGVKNGDILAFACKVERAKLFKFDDFSTYYFRNNIGYNASISRKQVTISEGYLKADESYRLHVKGLLEKGMDEKYASICYAVLFGDKQDIDNEVKTAFRDAGIVHILAVSGLHVGFLVAVLNFFLKKCKLNKYIIFAMVFVFLAIYAWLCGFSPSVVRASIMAIVVLGSRLGSRRYDRLTSLGLAGFIIILLNPLSALDVGFLMSFFCVASIFFVQKPLANLLSKVFPKKVSDLAAISIAAQLGILPFLSFFSESFNLLSVFANLIVIPLFSIVFPVLFVFTILISILTFAAPCFVIFEWAFKFIFYVASFFAQTSLRVPLSKLDKDFVLAFFVLLFSCSKYFLTKGVTKAVFVSGCLLLLSLVSILNLIPIKSPSIDIVSIGSSQAAIITSDSGQRLLVGQADYDQFKKYATRTKVRDLDFIVSDGVLDKEGIKIIDNYACNCAVVKDSLSSERDDIVEAKINQNMTLGDFNIKYIEEDNVFVGIEISYSNRSIFFASSDKMSYNESAKAAKYLSGQDYNLAILGHNDRLSSLFAGATTASLAGTKDLSYKELGNFRLTYSGSWQTRSLD